MQKYIRRTLLFSAALITTLNTFASVPPDHKEPTRKEMRALGFKYKIQRDEASSSIDLYFPKSVRHERFTLIPHSTNVEVRNLAGQVLSSTTNWVGGNEFMSIATSYDHKVTDLSMSVTYACPPNRESGRYGAMTLNIPSISKFIDANPDLVNVRPHCRNLTNWMVDCTKYDNPDYP